MCWHWQNNRTIHSSSNCVHYKCVNWIKSTMMTASPWILIFNCTLTCARARTFHITHYTVLDKQIWGQQRIMSNKYSSGSRKISRVKKIRCFNLFRYGTKTAKKLKQKKNPEPYQLHEHSRQAKLIVQFRWVNLMCVCVLAQRCFLTIVMVARIRLVPRRSRFGEAFARYITYLVQWIRKCEVSNISIWNIFFILGSEAHYRAHVECEWMCKIQ